MDEENKKGQQYKLRISEQELTMLQALPLDVKIQKTLHRIEEFYQYFGGNVYISFSGGKDSTVLLYLARQLYPDIPVVFCDTWMEYPEVRKFTKLIYGVTRLKPKRSMKEILEEFGWNFPSKDVANCIYYARKGSLWALRKLQGLNSDGSYCEYKQQYKKWSYLLDLPHTISDGCCIEMKEKPLMAYEKESKKYPIVALMAAEKGRRKQAYLRTGCNSFESDRPMSKPMGFWTEQDVLRFLLLKKQAILQMIHCDMRKNGMNEDQIAKRTNPWADTYGEIVEKTKMPGQVTVQWLFGDFEHMILQTTQEERTGCMFCPVGCHLDGGAKYKRLKKKYPKIYQFFMKPVEEGGYGLGQFLKDIQLKEDLYDKTE